MARFYITTPIYYVNDVPHIGHAYTTTAADVAVRFHRQLGHDVYFLTGTDEHGAKIEQAACARGLTPKEHADEIVVKFREVAQKVNASIDFLIRTTDPAHERFVQGFVQKCYDNGDVYQSSYSGLYCPACEAYYIEENLVDGLCPDHGTKPVRMEEDNYFFRLSAYQDRLLELYRVCPDWVRPRHRYNEALSFIEQGLDDISISRATLKWGITVPWDPSQVIYVWIDALLSYLSALHFAPGQDLMSRFWPPTYHLMAQDILKFHAIIWPALLMSAGYDLPEHLFIHGYLKLGGEKMSKTRGNVMDPFPLIEEYGADPFRFYCLREVGFGQDGMVSEEGFKSRYNSELPNDLGNLVSRTISMIVKYRGGVIPAPACRPVDSPLAQEAERAAASARAQLEELDLSGALETIWTLVRRLNRYVEEMAPWKQAKDGDGVGLDSTLWDLAEGLRLLSVLLYPFMPGTALEMRARLGLRTPAAAAGGAAPGAARDAKVPVWNEARWGLLPDGATVVSGPPLFPRIES
jgi:methionyl-tRNA synthetase